MSETTVIKEDFSADHPKALEYVRTLQGMLIAEATLLEEFRTFAQNNCRIPPEDRDFTKLMKALNDEKVMHVARFFFLLRALDCSNPTALLAFIESHNAKIESILLDETGDPKRKGQLKKAKFNRTRKLVCVDTLKGRPRVALARTEIESFLFEHMSPDTVTKGVDVLVKAGLLTETDADDGTNRILVQTDGFLEQAIAAYLNNVRELVAVEIV